MTHSIELPLTREKTEKLRCGDAVLLSGVLYTARDAAHKRLVEALGTPDFPFPLAGATLYYVGPTPARPHRAIGSAGPTTSYRMDPYTPALISGGLMGMIGKGMRGDAVVAAMRDAGAVYFGAIGGAGALLAGCVKKCEVVAYPDLGPEAVHRLEVRDFPAVVVIDSRGQNLYQTGPEAYLQSL